MNRKWTLLSSVLTFSLLSPAFATAPNACTTGFLPYHLMSLNMSGGQPMNLVNVSKSTGINGYNLAFIIDSGRCSPAWDGEYSISSGWGKSLTDSMRAAGIRYNVSFGGASGADISQSCSVQQLTAAYEKVITTYQPTGLDFDIENGSANVATIMSALPTIQKNYPNVKLSFTLPVMPEGLDSTAKSVISQAKKANLNFVVNIMTMDYGPSYSGNMAQYATSALNATFSYLKGLYPEKSTAQVWAMIAATPMIGVNDVTSEKFTVANATALTSFAQQNGMAWLAMWSLDRDHPCSGTTPKENCSSGNLQTKDYQFSGEFNQCGPTPPPPPPPPPPPSKDCLPPANITYSVARNKRAIAFKWQAPSGSAPISAYQVNDYEGAKLWSGAATNYTDSTLDGSPGTYEYYFLSHCAAGDSSPVEVAVRIRR